MGGGCSKSKKQPNKEDPIEKKKSGVKSENTKIKDGEIGKEEDKNEEVNESTKMNLEEEKKVEIERIDPNKLNIPELFIYFGSETGTAEGFAHLLAEDANNYDIKAQILGLDQFEEESFKKHKFVILVVATHGEGEPATNASKFFYWLVKNKDPRIFSNISFTIFGLGDSTFDTFNQNARETCQAMINSGANL
jgi:sulfite reductase alpha subunit-like flavoprotein